MDKYFTSEMVGSGHPDKICDLIGDSILDAILEQDENSRVAIETTGGKRKLFVTGEVKTTAKVDYCEIIRKAMKAAGYPEYNTIEIILNIGQQSQDINIGVDQDNDIGAGDQGIMFGYAINETPQYLSREYYWTKTLAEYIHNNKPKEYGFDFKTQITSKNGKIDTVLVSILHPEKKYIEDVRKDIKKLIKECFKDENYKYNILINPTGRFTIGYFDGDAGTTGRKLVVDSYGGKARIGGGAYSGKDYTKVDRSAAYYTRYVAKNIVANGLADEVEIQVAYAIGKSRPLSVEIETFGTEKIEKEEILNIVNRNFDFSVKNIIDELNLKNVKYTKYTNYGHYGKDDCPWERIIELK